MTAFDQFVKCRSAATPFPSSTGVGVRDRFPGDFWLELNDAERDTLVSQSVMPSHQPKFLAQAARESETSFRAGSTKNVLSLVVRELLLQARLPAEFKGRLPTAKQLADAVRQARSKDEL